MKLLLWLAPWAVFSLPIFAANPGHQAKDGHALIELEQTWAKALEMYDAEAVDCVLAEEFQDADLRGKLHERAETLAPIRHRHPGRNVLSELNPHVLGASDYVCGLASLLDRQGNTVARVGFTDISVYRDQRWAAVAGQETLLPEAAR